MYWSIVRYTSWPPSGSFKTRRVGMKFLPLQSAPRESSPVAPAENAQAMLPLPQDPGCPIPKSQELAAKKPLRIYTLGFFSEYDAFQI